MSFNILFYDFFFKSDKSRVLYLKNCEITSFQTFPHSSKNSNANKSSLKNIEYNVSKTAHGGGHYDEDWGGVPVVIFLGDDYQIPPVK